MLTFDQKLAIITSFPELQRKDVSLGRVNFHYEESVHEKQTVVYHLHPNGNGFVFAGLLKGVPTDAKGMVNIRDFESDELKQLIARSITSLTGDSLEVADTRVAREPKDSFQSSRAEFWRGPGGARLTLLLEDDLWYVYAGKELEMAFETYEESVQYLQDEQFRRE
ncbi:hypothetical protein I6N90_18445 [Paenibacillus sp. GSMTC-2017]|uniref:hypothetical protein n=1 Tax=Paenibacillus sp. GSMTC-2017 TaxID=2794350 RepID=UPI0018D70FF2|nr:hypothetical protein [Paenibacillus sp. GSMTC-2017]MBH5319782.1 hypothetical protein [Paenibacillus sp. GSMTC-2017]